MAINQRCNIVFIDVELTEGEKPGISNDEADNSITKWLVTAILSCLVMKSIPQGTFIRSKNLSQILFDDNLLDAHAQE